jgi:hypothetical protein
MRGSASRITTTVHGSPDLQRVNRRHHP